MPLRLYSLLVTLPVLALAQQGTITTLAGTGVRGFSGDNGPAANAQLGTGSGTVLGVATDNAGNVYIVDGGNNRIRKVTPAGIISTVAGGGGTIGDGGQATRAQLFPGGVAVDGDGNLFIAQGASIRKVNAAGIISTIAGTGLPGFSGDGGPATSAALTLPQGLATDSVGNVYFAVLGRIRKVDTAGTITTVAGNGSALSIGDGGPATSAGMSPIWVSVDGDGNLYIADTGGHRIRKVNTSGTISTFAGGNGPGFSGDGGPAVRAQLFGPTCVASDAAGNVYIADTNNGRIRKVSAGATGSPISVTPANLSFSYTTGTPNPPSQSVVIFSLGSTLTFTAAVSDPWLSVSPASGSVNNTLSISVSPGSLAPGIYNGTVTLNPSGAGNTPQTIPVRLTVSGPVSTGVISTVAGNGLIPFTTPGPATTVSVGISALALDSSGNIYIADTISNRVLKVDTAGTLAPFAGNGAFSFAGDGGPAVAASLFAPSALATDPAGNLYIADTTNNRIRKVTPAGIVSTVAGNGQPTLSGDGGPATAASLFFPIALAFDSAGNLLIADSGNNRVRKVTPAGIISTIAGALLPGFGGDGGPATAANIFLPGGLAVDSAGNIFLADMGNNRIRKISAAGIISTVAGNGTKAFSGDGGPATAGSLNLFGGHAGLAIDAAGNLFIPDVANNRIRKVDPAGIITTVAGNGIGGFSGDGGPATAAGLNNPLDVAFDTAGNLFIADGLNRRIRKVTFPNAAPPPAISANGVVNGASFSPGLSPNSWATILGANLSAATNTWASAIVNGRLPDSLENVKVTIAGKPAYLYFVSPGQINLLVPDIAPGPAPLIVTTAAGASSTFTVNITQFAPTFFLWPGKQPVASRQDFSFAAKAGTFDGLSTTPARPGDVLILWGTGFGPTTPSAPAGVQLPADRTYSAATPPGININSVAATVYGAALAPGFAGLYQIAIQVPPNLPDGEWPVTVTLGGQEYNGGALLNVRR